jgi:hypothetical protein
MMADFSEDLPAWKRLQEATGLQIDHRQTDPKSFGDTLVLLRRGSLRLRLVRDRGEWACERLNLHDGTWEDVEQVLLDAGSTNAPRTRTDIERLLDVLHTNWSRVVSDEAAT